VEKAGLRAAGGSPPLRAAALAPKRRGSGGPPDLSARAGADAGLRNSPEITKLYNKIILQKTNTTSPSRRSRRRSRIRRVSAGRPLLSFKFPEQFDLAEEYEINIKTPELQIDLSKLKHQLADQKFAVLERSYRDVNVYILQEKISFTRSCSRMPRRSLHATRRGSSPATPGSRTSTPCRRGSAT
jgi:hypothetical protein